MEAEKGDGKRDGSGVKVEVKLEPGMGRTDSKSNMEIEISSDS